MERDGEGQSTKEGDGIMDSQTLQLKKDYFSDLDLANRKFKRLAWASALLFLGVMGVLIVQIASVMK